MTETTATRSPEAHSSRLAVPGGEVHVLRRGEGPPLLFLHAAGGAGAWHRVHELLAARFDVIAPDHPGFGQSDDLERVGDITDLVFHYRDVCEALGVERAHVVGASFGGWIAAELAVHAPWLVDRLVLIAPAGLRLPEATVTDLFLLTPEKVPPVLFKDPGCPAAAALFGGEPDVDTILAVYREMGSLARFAWKPFMSDPKLEGRLRHVAAPTLVVSPEEDRLIPRAHAERYAERIPGARHTVVADAGHAVHFEQPEATAAAVLEFLTGGSEA